MIEYEKFEEVQVAIKDLDGADLYKQIMSVDWAFSSGPAKRRNTRKRYSLLFKKVQHFVFPSLPSFFSSCVSLLDPNIWVVHISQ